MLLLGHVMQQRGKLYVVPPRLCPYMIAPYDCDHMTVPAHVCAHTRLWPHKFVPRHICAQTWLCPDTFVLRQDCANMIVHVHDCTQTRLCPDTLVPQHELWPDTIIPLDNNNIIIVSTRLYVNLIGENTSKHAQLLLAKRSEMWSFNYFSAITGSNPTGIFRNFIKTSQGTKICVWAQTSVGKKVFGPKRVWAQTGLGTIVCAQACMGTNVWSLLHVYS